MIQNFHSFLNALPTHILHTQPADAVLRSGLDKAGILPFLTADGGLQLCVMLPKAVHPELGRPAWQLCKGTRMVQDAYGSAWRDMRKDEGEEAVSGKLKAEHLATTALREGHEELGLIPQAIAELFDLGTVDFTSASTGKTKQMWLFAVRVDDPTSALLPMQQVTPTTDARRWCSMEEFAKVGRMDHVPIVRQSILALEFYLNRIGGIY